MARLMDPPDPGPGPLVRVPGDGANWTAWSIEELVRLAGFELNQVNAMRVEYKLVELEIEEFDQPKPGIEIVTSRVVVIRIDQLKPQADDPEAS